jgi:hypothetical protein
VLKVKRGEVIEPGLSPSQADEFEVSVNRDTWGMGIISIKVKRLVYV